MSNLATESKDEKMFDVSVAEASSYQKWYLLNERAVLGVLSVIGFLIIWELAARSGIVNPMFISSPSLIFHASLYIFGKGQIWQDMYVSGLEFIIGFGLAIVIGIPVGIAAGWSRKFNYCIDPFLSALYATPRVALLPLIIIWVGIFMPSKVAIVFLGAFFPIAINTLSGMRVVDSTYLKMAKSFSASDMTILRTIALPGSVPFILTGLRLGVGRGLVGVVVGELFAAQAGLGYRLTYYGQLFQVHRMMVYIIIIAFLGVVCVEVLTRVERRFDKWRPETGH